MKSKQLTQQLNQSSIISNIRPKLLSYSLHKMLWSSLASAVLVPATLLAMPAYASELDVYEKAGPKPEDNSFGPTVMLVLPNSSSMGCQSISFDNKEIPFALGTGDCTKTRLPITQLNTDGTRTPLTYIAADGTSKQLTYEVESYTYKGKTYYTRMSKMVTAILELLDHPEKLPAGTKLGLAYYGYGGESRKILNVNNDLRPFIPMHSGKLNLEANALEGRFFRDASFGGGSIKQSGLISVPAGSVTNVEHVNRIKRAIAQLYPYSLMPIAKAYAETTAYLLGSSTANLTKNIEKTFYPIREKDGNFYMCVRFKANSCQSGYWAPLLDKYKAPYMQLLDTDEDGKYITRMSDAGGWTEYQYTGTFIKGNDDPARNSSYDKFTKPHQSKADLEKEIAKDPSEYQRYEIAHRNYVNSKTSILTAYRQEDIVNKDPSIVDILYKSPLGDISTNQCGASAAGIYFLTDGFADIATDGDGINAGARSYYPTEVAEEQLKNVFRQIPGEDFSCAPLPEVKPCFLCKGDYNYGPDYAYTGEADTKGNTNLGYSGWRCIIPLAQQLTKKSDNRNATIKTAVVGYGHSYTSAINKDDEDDKDADKNYTSITECSKVNKGLKDSKLACDWGNSGEGGFYVAKNGDGIAETIIDFAEKLSGGDYQPQSGDSLSIGANVTDATKSSSLAYLPLMEPRPSTANLTWAGNINKYKVKDGSLFDQNDKHIYNSITGQIKSTSKELWNTSATADGGAVRGATAAGAYAQLVAPNSTHTDSTRKVYVEKSGGGIQQISVQANVPSGVNTLGYAEHTRQKAHYLLNFLGYDVPVFNPKGARITDADYKGTGDLKDQTDPLTNIADYVPESPTRVLGGVNNSKPQEVIYETSEQYNADTGATVSANSTYMLFGSMDGALHLVDGSDGKEKFAFIPKPIIESDHSIAALKEESTMLADGNVNSVGNVSHGIDAPWHVRTKYHRKIEADSTAKTTKVTLTTQEANKSFVKVYGGLGRTGVGFYGLDITNVDSPSLLFKIDRDTRGFSRLGSTWSAPVEAKVKYKETADSEAVAKDVLFISGGYDKCFDDKTFNIQSTGGDVTASCATKGQTYGSAVYMVDADTGELLWSTSADADSDINTHNEHIKYSVVGEVAVIDTNLNGFVDSIYFADLGGQVFRANFNDDKDINAPSDDTDPGWVTEVTRVLNTTVTGTTAEPYIPLRFYQRPVVSAYKFNIVKKDDEITSVETNSKGSNLTYVLSVASGDRNNPLAKLPQRQANKEATDKHHPDKLFTIWNANTVSDVKLEKSETDGISSDLIKLSWDEDGTGDDMSLTNKANLIDGIKKGWYDDITYFKGETSQDTEKPADSTSPDVNEGKKVKSVIGTKENSQAGAVGYNINYLKSFGQPALRGGRLYISVYNRLAYIPLKDACSPVPTGVTEAQEYCLPFGKCVNGRGMSHVLGAGLSSANFAAIDEGSSYFSLVTPEVVKFKEAADSDPDPKNPVLAAIKGVYHSLYDLLPNVWFERTPAPTEETTTTDTSGT